MKTFVVLIMTGTFAFSSSSQLHNYLITNDSLISSPLTGEGKGEGVTNSPQLPVTPAPQQYVIESGDLLEINILGEAELSRTLMVRHNGTISFALIGE